MARMLAGALTIIIRPGLLSMAGLARETQVDRNHITQGSCRDLGDRLAALTQHRAAPVTAREPTNKTRASSSLTTRFHQRTESNAALRAVCVTPTRGPKPKTSSRLCG